MCCPPRPGRHTPQALRQHEQQSGATLMVCQKGCGRLANPGYSTCCQACPGSHTGLWLWRQELHILVQYPCFVNMGAVDWSILDNDWCWCTACLHMDHLDRRSSHFDRVSDIHEHQRTATCVQECRRSKDEGLLRPGVRMMLCQTLYAMGHACSAKVVKP